MDQTWRLVTGIGEYTYFDTLNNARDYADKLECLAVIEWRVPGVGWVRYVDKGSDEHSGNKYLREVVSTAASGKVDVYDVIEMFQVTCPARQHAIKKLLCSGLRGKGGSLQDLTEARDAVNRAIELEQHRAQPQPPNPVT